MQKFCVDTAENEPLKVLLIIQPWDSIFTESPPPPYSKLRNTSYSHRTHRRYTASWRSEVAFFKRKQGEKEKFRMQEGTVRGYFGQGDENLEQVAESGRPGRPELLAKKGRIVGGVGCPPNCRTSGKPRGKPRGKLRESSDLLEP